MADYSDYGHLYGFPSAKQITTQPKERTQVYKATHEGELYLPFMDRSFISFSYGGKNIEDFNMIATTDGDRMSKEAYASFEDITTTYSTLTGQFYWGTYYRNNSIHFRLATDGTTQKQLDSFKHWFAAGKTKELILSEHPNRAIMARVSEPPQINVLAFESPVQVKLDGSYYTTKTTLYKGEIDLTLTMDEPYWYAKINIFGQRDNDGVYRNTWKDANGQQHSVIDNPDALKVLYEDGIPIASMIQHTMLFGSNIFASVEFQVYGRIIVPINQVEYEDNAGTTGYYNNGLDWGLKRELNGEILDSPWYKGAVIARVDANGRYISGGKVAGATMNDQTGIQKLDAYRAGNEDTTVSFYYAGTAPSPTILKFTLYPDFDNKGYITSPANNYSTNLPSHEQYNTITIEGEEEKKEFRFTTPNIYTSYNQIIRIFDNDELIAYGTSWATIRELIRETVWHPEVRAWANRAIDVFDDEDGQGTIDKSQALINPRYTPENIKTLLKDFMLYFFKPATGSGVLPVRFTFNAKTGESFGEFQHRSSIGQSAYDKSYDDGYPGINWANYCKNNVISVKENVGDMVKSKYLIIEERNYPNEDNNIVAWRQDSNYAHRIYHNVVNGLSNIYIDYQNLYL